MLAEELIQEFPEEKEKEEFEAWVEESHTASKEIVYIGIKYKDSPSKDYLDKAYQLIRKRITVGGYRLGNEIIKIYKKYKAERDMLLRDTFE
jgi:hypothetical protein